MKQVQIPPGMHTYNRAFFDYVTALHRKENPEMPESLRSTDEEKLMVAVNETLQSLNRGLPLTFLPESGVGDALVYDPHHTIQVLDVNDGNNRNIGIVYKSVDEGKDT